jgi:hypothetical protein
MDNTEYIYASNGSGEAPRLTVTAARAALATTLTVDATTNLPAKFVATSGTLNTDTGLLDPATIKVFRGHIASGKIEIDQFAPGYTDTGNSVGQVVVLKPSTEWANIIAGALNDAKDSLGGDNPVKLVVSETQPSPESGKTVIWFEPLA